MAVQPDDAQEMQGRVDALRTLIARYRGRMEDGLSLRTAAAYLQGIHAAEAEITEIERHAAELIHPESAPPERR